jgi:hypothetical protein
MSEERKLLFPKEPFMLRTIDARQNLIRLKPAIKPVAEKQAARGVTYAKEQPRLLQEIERLFKIQPLPWDLSSSIESVPKPQHPSVLFVDPDTRQRDTLLQLSLKDHQRIQRDEQSRQTQ